MVSEKGCVVFTFSPWSVQNWSDLWEEFGSRLLEALTAADIPFDGSWKKTAKDSGKWLESAGLGQVGETTAALLGKEKIYNTAFPVLSRWLRYNGAQIRAIREKLEDRRLVVLIDDLDRCAPELVPQLLMSLRELLDLPGFTFLLAFDDEIVAQALAAQNPAWADGTDFLEKILDFRFHLPSVTEPQKARMIHRAIAKYCPFVPIASTSEILDLLPDNPRRLKALVRSLTALQPQIARHDPDELNWVDMWLAQMLRLESHAFFERLLQGDTLEEETGTTYRLTRRLSKRRGESKEEDENQSLIALMKEVGLQNPVSTQRLTRLVEAVRSRASLRFKYVCELAARPHSLTWKEFRLFYEKWCNNRTPSVIADWIAHHARARAVSEPDVEDEFFSAMLTRRSEVLSSAAESKSIEEHGSYSSQAGELLEMLAQFLNNPNKLTGPRFKQVYDQASYWAGFRKNPGDQKLREKEELVLLNLASSASVAVSVEIFEALRPNAWDIDMGDGSRVMRQALREKCLTIVVPKASREAISFLAKDGGVRALLEAGRFVAMKYLLFNPDSPIWKSELRGELLGLIRKGEEDITVYRNTRDLFELLADGLRQGLDGVDQRQIARTISDKEFAGALWKVVTSRGIQYRMRKVFLNNRQLMIENGAAEASMPLTPELLLRMQEDPPSDNPAPAI